VDLGIHLPLMQFRDEGLSLRRLAESVDAARECGFSAVSSNDHFVFSTPWLDGPTALASMIERRGDMTPATTVSLAVLRGPVALAKTLAALDVLSEGRLIAALGPGSSKRDYDALGIPFDDRWKRFDEAIAVLRGAAQGKFSSRGGALLPRTLRHRARAGSSQGRHTALDWKLGLGRRAAPRRAGRRRLARLRVQHDAGRVRRSA
jgi:alkanesulfonate monooxygenase SsuD/methylene tetrahydromethanopterin reductase-like flavin-dependent oxidoreductase (luciferase family)